MIIFNYFKIKIYVFQKEIYFRIKNLSRALRSHRPHYESMNPLVRAGSCFLRPALFSVWQVQRIPVWCAALWVPPRNRYGWLNQEISPQKIQFTSLCSMILNHLLGPSAHLPAILFVAMHSDGKGKLKSSDYSPMATYAKFLKYQPASPISSEGRHRHPIVTANGSAVSQFPFESDRGSKTKQICWNEPNWGSRTKQTRWNEPKMRQKTKQTCWNEPNWGSKTKSTRWNEPNWSRLSWCDQPGRGLSFLTCGLKRTM